ncbi:hypothetical protein VE02_09633 [Pseudogymnoascus sp. 03VT05]|nr:hypothetical protein VE02_09633 [Pseudogymnoascus sp. 03VT05]
MASKFKALIFDLGGVLLDWDPQSVTAVTSTQLQTSIIKESLDQAQKSLTVNVRLARIAQELKKSDLNLQLYVMSNISREHFEIVQTLDLPWSMFSSAFTSGNVGMRKPDLCFFKHAIDKIGFHPSQVVMVDDQAENLCAAQSLGIHGLLVDETSVDIVGQKLRNLFQSSIPRVEAYMKANARNHNCVVEGHSITLKDNFAQLLIWELTGDANIIYFKWPSGKLHPAQNSGNGNGNMEASVKANVKNGLWNYFYEDPVLTTQEFPADADTTSTAYLSLPQSYLSGVADVHLILDKMAFNMSPDGIMQTYFCDDRPRTAPETADWVVQCLKNRACLYGNRVYSTPETFLYFTARLYLECGEGTLKKRLETIKEALLKRINAPTNPLALALRISACKLVGLDPLVYQQDLEKLMSLQEEDGGFPAGHFCCFGRTGARIGNRGLTTALAIKIIRRDS